MRTSAWVVALLVVALAGVNLAGARGSELRSAHRAASASERAARIRELDIEFYRARTERDTLGARDRAVLAGLYLQRARESGDQLDLVRAEEAARQSLRLRTGHNEVGIGVLASSLLAQHRFVEAREVARTLLAMDSASVSARGLLAEVELELGDYGEAARLFGSLGSYAGEPMVAARLARWRELQGRPEEARRLLRRARDEARGRYLTPPEQIAWFALRLGDLALRHGHLDEAERELRGGLRIAPEDYRLLSTLARLHAVRHDWAAAAQAAERVIAVVPDPSVLGLLHDAHRALGDTSTAESYLRATRQSVLGQPGSYHRAWSLFLLDHGLDISTVLTKAEAELRDRRDIYGYDLQAWALHHSGRHEEARAAVRQALRLGTRDAMLCYHAGMIDHALGLEASAATHLRSALTINPQWHPFQPTVARAVLDTLEG